MRRLLVLSSKSDRNSEISWPYNVMPYVSHLLCIPPPRQHHPILAIHPISPISRSSFSARSWCHHLVSPTDRQRLIWRIHCAFLPSSISFMRFRLRRKARPAFLTLRTPVSFLSQPEDSLRIVALEHQVRDCMHAPCS